MKTLQIIHPEMGQIRTKVDGKQEPWFAAKDVCEILGLENSSQAISRLDDDEKGVISSDTPGGKQKLAAVNESGLYNLIFQSRKPEAKKFRKWVTSEVLPCIRKHGQYPAPQFRYLPESNAQAVQDYQLIMYRKIMKVESARVRNELAGLVEYLSHIIK